MKVVEEFEYISCEALNNILSNLTGLYIISTTRAANMERLKIGTSVDKGIKLIGKNNMYAVHLQCAWRFRNRSEVIVGSSDLYYSATLTEYDPDFNWDEPNANRRDKKLNELISDTDLVISAFEADIFGGFKLHFLNDIVLETFTDESNCDPYQEFWRLLNNNAVEPCHYVSTPTGYYSI